MLFDHIIVQAGGKGTRMKQLTRNKPKALVPVNNLPMLFHLFKKYPRCEFTIIGDYKYDVLEKYLSAFSEVKYTLVNAAGKSGTCAGLKMALEHIPENRPFMLIWSDLILSEDFDTSDIPDGNYVGVSSGFECRWKYENKTFSEEPSSTSGVAGMFIFENKSVIDDVAESGEFVRWLSVQKIEFSTIPLERTKEYGLISEYIKLETEKCRPFNKLTIKNGCVIKEGIDEQGRKLAVRERAWYEKVRSSEFKNLPEIYSTDPLKIELINGRNIYEYQDIGYEEKKVILTDIVDCIKKLHEYGSAPYDEMSYNDAYLGKTFERLEKVRDLVPFAHDKIITVNGRKCRNVFDKKAELAEMFKRYKPSEFVFLHGDCTFSNIMLRNGSEPVLIDPRGYFGKTEFFGDPAYDWAKLYYSIVGNYDQFNLKRFDLFINSDNIDLKINSTRWESLEPYFFDLLKNEVNETQIKLIHAVIWLSLTTYAWQDYDSICGAFYNGLYYLEEIL